MKAPLVNKPIKKLNGSEIYDPFTKGLSLMRLFKFIKQNSKIMNTKSEIMRMLISATCSCMLLLLSSCIKEDMSNCPEEIRIYFQIPTPEGGTEINPLDVDMMHLYVFDKKGYYLGEYHDEYIPDFKEDEYFIDCSDLLPAQYRFIAWAGKDERFYATEPGLFVKGKTLFEDALLMLQHPNNIVSEEIHHLFYSDLSATVTVEKVQRFDMPLLQQTNTIRIHTVGFPADVDVYTFNIADNNCSYLFDHSFADLSRAGVSNSEFTYTAPCEKDAGSQIRSKLNVMRLSGERHTPQLQIFNQTTGKLLYPADNNSGDLIELIKSFYPENNFDAVHIYDIVLTCVDPDEPTAFTVTILINGWVVSDQEDNI